MAPPEQLFFLRHGETEWNREKRMQGRLDSDLTEVGRAQAEGHGALLAEHAVGGIFASPLGRVRQTVAIVREQLDVPVEFDDRLVEWDCGVFSGHLYSEVRKRWASEWEALVCDRYGYRAPGAENWPDMIARSAPFLEEVTALEGGVVAVVSHGLIGRVMLHALTGLGRERAVALRQPNDTVFRLRFEGRRIGIDRYVGGVGPLAGWGTV